MPSSVPPTPRPATAGPPGVRHRDGRYRSWPVRVVLAVVVYLVALNVGLVVVALVPGTVGRIEAAAVALVELLAAAAAFWVVVGRLEGRTPSEAGFSPRRAPQHLALGLGIGATLAGGAAGVLVATGSYSVGPGDATIGVLAAVAVVVAAAALGEEIVFRLLLLRTLESGLGSGLALLVTGALFGVAHLGNAGATWVGAAAVALSGGLLLGAAYLLTRSIWLPLGLHLGVNLVQTAVLGSPVSGRSATGPALLESAPSGPEWWTGGEFGVEASVLVLSAGLVLGLVTVLLAWRRERWIPYRQRRPGNGAGTPHPRP